MNIDELLAKNYEKRSSINPAQEYGISSVTFYRWIHFIEEQENLIPTGDFRPPVDGEKYVTRNGDVETAIGDNYTSGNPRIILTKKLDFSELWMFAPGPQPRNANPGEFALVIAPSNNAEHPTVHHWLTGTSYPVFIVLPTYDNPRYPGKKR